MDTPAVSTTLPDDAKIVVLRALQLGDLLCAVPFFRSIKQRYPGSRLSLITLPWGTEFKKRFPHLIDEVILFPGWPGLPEQHLSHAEIPGFLSTLQERSFDLALQAHGSGLYVNQIIELINAKQSAGFYAEGIWCPEGGLFIPYPDSGHEIRRLLKLGEVLGLDTNDTSLEFPITEKDRGESEELMLRHSLEPHTYICLHCGSRGDDRRWPISRFAEVATTLSQRGFQVVLTGSKEERARVEELQYLIGKGEKEVINIAGETSLGAIGALLSTARLLISNDTGVSHIAAALKVPSVVLFTGSDPLRWAPLDRERHLAVPAAHTVTGEQVAALSLEYLQRLP